MAWVAFRRLNLLAPRDRTHKARQRPPPPSLRSGRPQEHPAPLLRPATSPLAHRCARMIEAILAFRAPLAELVDAPDSKSGSERSAGSIPARGTNVSLFSELLRLKPSLLRQRQDDRHLTAG